MPEPCEKCNANPVDIARTTPGTPTAKLIAILVAHGITNAADLAEIVGISDRAVRKARNSRTGTPVPPGTTGPELQDRPGTPVPKTELQDRNSSSASRADSIINITNTTQDSLEKGSSNEEPKKSAPKTKKGPGRAQALEAFQAYNAAALRCALPQAARMTPDRERRIIARLKDYGFDGWMRAIENIEHSAFLTGQNDRGFRADLDFLLQATSFGKVHDGRYGNGRAAPSAPRMSFAKFAAEQGVPS